MSDILYERIDGQPEGPEITNRLIEIIENEIPAIPLTEKERDILIFSVMTMQLKSISINLKAGGYLNFHTPNETDYGESEAIFFWNGYPEDYLHSYVFYRDGRISENVNYKEVARN